MSDMTAEERATRLFNAARASAAEDPIFYEFICNQIREAEQAAAAQAQAGVDALAEEIVALREDLEKARAEEREACALQVRHDCAACEGTGHMDTETECEYCGRPMAAIRDRSTD